MVMMDSGIQSDISDMNSPSTAGAEISDIKNESKPRKSVTIQDYDGSTPNTPAQSPKKVFFGQESTPTAAKGKIESRVTFSDNALNELSKSSEPESSDSVLSKSPKSNLFTNTTSIIVCKRPLRRSISTESRDNPFVPGGNLSKEADDLLSKSTIIRDKFYIDGQNVSRTDQSRNDPFSESVENKENIDVTNNAIPVESTITPEASASVEAKSPKKDKEKGKAKSKTKSKTKENGKVDDSVSPDGVKVELSKSTSAPSEEGKSTEAQQDAEKNKKKKNACCSVM